MSEAEPPMREPRVEKVVVNMGVGRGGSELQQAEDILASITGQTPVRTEAKRTEPTFDVREGAPIGTKVTLRGETAEGFLETVFDFVTLEASQFDETGNVSFGIQEHTDFPSQEYDPNVGLYGMDVTVNLVRPGYRIAKRDRASRSIPASHRLEPERSIAYLTERFGAVIDDE